MSRVASSMAWLRWMLAAVACAALRQTPTEVAPLACGGGRHAWWVVRADPKGWEIRHADLVADGAPPSCLVAGAFDDEPVALAAEEDRVWVAFASTDGRCEVLGAQVDRNPASGLAFLRPPGWRLCASLPFARLDCLGAFDGTVWAIEQGAPRAWRLRGERWEVVELPAEAASAAHRALAATAEGLWLLADDDSGRPRRWRRQLEAWQPVPLQVSAWAQVVSGASRLSLRLADGTVGSVQQGAFVPECRAAADTSVLAWGDGFAALQLDRGTALLAASELGTGRFGPAQEIKAQRSRAGRWYHLPLLGVAVAGALIAYAIVRGVEPAASAPVRDGLVPLGLRARLVALIVDAAPAIALAAVMFDQPLSTVLRPLSFATDIEQGWPTLVAVAVIVFFGAVEEMAGGASFGKRLLGGRVLRADGSRAAAWRHALRNLLKGLLLMAPALALFTLLSGGRRGISEVLSGTVVVRR